MNEEIITNLFEFWTFIGEKTGKFIKGEGYKAFNLFDSDWPNRVFHLNINKLDIEALVDKMKTNNLPNLITIPGYEDRKFNDAFNNAEVKLRSQQKGMALMVDENTALLEGNNEIKLVENREEASTFATLASKSFGYRVDVQMLSNLINSTDRVKLFIGGAEGVYLSCGIVFYDSMGNAGFHMIGTLPEGRGKGLGKSMTQQLIRESIQVGRKKCVLHASKAGEELYKKLGFAAYDTINTYTIPGENVRYPFK